MAWILGYHVKVNFDAQPRKVAVLRWISCLFGSVILSMPTFALIDYSESDDEAVEVPKIKSKPKCYSINDSFSCDFIVANTDRVDGMVQIPSFLSSH